MKSSIDELANRIENALSIDEKIRPQQGSTDEVTTRDQSKLGNAEHARISKDGNVNAEADQNCVGIDSDSTSSSNDYGASQSSSSDSDSDDERDIYSGPPPPLAVHMPLLPADSRSVFAKDQSALDAIVEIIRNGRAKKIVVMAGAGISTDAGIPDFRSPGTGLYDNLQSYNLPYPEAIFSIDYFKKSPKPFYVLAKELYPGQFVPTQSHFFIKMLADQGLLQRHYTQNIDCLERVAGIDPELIVEAHGSFHTAHCIGKKCRKEFSQSWVREKIFADEIPRCDTCTSLIKPDITFFGEGLPSRFFDLLEHDFSSCDLLIVMGTSLLVQPFASLVNDVAESVPRLLINRVRVGEARLPGSGFDFDGKHVGRLHRDALILGDCDEACSLLAERLGWADRLAELRSTFMLQKTPAAAR
ncbi:NAD-dependent protein deacetylase sirtuin-2 [Coemansia erecta]|uniref:NAD-dependent protein deacetylase sirtuin-2 n=1 Tax=Coemansia erecta TaxID=147472 RepID=A0A9W8CU27_9FUNG|nr:NAD-dependent protein deacetylase sirtuin-2 [Coemansia erecta]